MLFYRKVTFRSDMSNFDNAEINIDLKFLDGMNIAKQMTEFQTKKSHPKVANSLLLFLKFKFFTKRNFQCFDCGKFICFFGITFPDFHAG